MKHKIFITIALLCLEITMTAQVGIGTDSPNAAAILEVHSIDKGILLPRLSSQNIENMNAVAGLMVYCTDCNTKGSLKIHDGNEWIDYVPASGGSFSDNVGIGTTSPVYPLVVSNGGAQGLEFIVGTMNYLQSYNRSASAPDYTPLSIDAETIAFATDNGSERMRIDASGIISFSETSTASFPAHSINAYSNGYTYLTGGANGLVLKDAGAFGSRVQINAGTIQFEASGSERMRIDSSGNVMVGKTSYSPDANGITLLSQGAMYITRGAASYGAEGIILNNSDSSGFWTAVDFRVAGINRGNIQVSTSGTQYLTSSDYRLKEDVQPVANASDRLMQLKPVNFAWKVDGKRADGFLAHQVDEVVPNAVSGKKDALDKDGNPDYQSLDHSKLVPLLTAALQEALERIEAFEELKQTLMDTLHKEIEKLKKQ